MGADYFKQCTNACKCSHSGATDRASWNQRSTTTDKNEAEQLKEAKRTSFCTISKRIHILHNPAGTCTTAILCVNIYRQQGLLSSTYYYCRIQHSLFSVHARIDRRRWLASTGTRYINIRCPGGRGTMIYTYNIPWRTQRDNGTQKAAPVLLGLIYVASPDGLAWRSLHRHHRRGPSLSRGRSARNVFGIHSPCHPRHDAYRTGPQCCFLGYMLVTSCNRHERRV